MEQEEKFELIDLVFIERALVFYLEEADEIEDEEPFLENLLAKTRKSVVNYALEMNKTKEN